MHFDNNWETMHLANFNRKLCYAKLNFVIGNSDDYEGIMPFRFTGNFKGNQPPGIGRLFPLLVSAAPVVKSISGKCYLRFILIKQHLLNCCGYSTTRRTSPSLSPLLPCFPARASPSTTTSFMLLRWWLVASGSLVVML